MGDMTCQECTDLRALEHRVAFGPRRNLHRAKQELRAARLHKHELTARQRRILLLQMSPMERYVGRYTEPMLFRRLHASTGAGFSTPTDYDHLVYGLQR